MLDKFTRAAEAVHQGAALVIELPAAFCLSAAPDFAYYAVKLLIRWAYRASVSAVNAGN